jgi:hypothetical protein
MLCAATLRTKRYERGSILLTTNIAFNDGLVEDDAFGDVAAAPAGFLCSPGFMG